MDSFGSRIKKKIVIRIFSKGVKSSALEKISWVRKYCGVRTHTI